MADGNQSPANTTRLNALAQKISDAKDRAIEADAVISLLAEVIAERVEEEALPGGWHSAQVAIRSIQQAVDLMDEVRTSLVNMKEKSNG